MLVLVLGCKAYFCTALEQRIEPPTGWLLLSPSAYDLDQVRSRRSRAVHSTRTTGADFLVCVLGQAWT